MIYPEEEEEAALSFSLPQAAFPPLPHRRRYHHRQALLQTSLTLSLYR